MKRIVLVILLFGACTFPAKADDPADKRVRFLASRLEAPILEIDKGEQNLLLLTEIIAAMASEAGADKDPKRRVTILINEEAFKKRTEGQFDQEKMQIKFSEKLVNKPLSYVLDIICAQFDGGYVVRNEHIEIVPIQDLREEIKEFNATDRELRHLVVGFFDDVPLSTAFRTLGEKQGRTVLLSPKAQTALEQKTKLRLVNVPFDNAVETLANVGGLKVVRKSNVYLVTTSEHATALTNDQTPKSETLRKDPIKK